MSDDKILDEQISRLVRSVERTVPPLVETRILAAAEGLRPRAGISFMRRPLWLALIPGAAAVILAALFWLPIFQKPRQPISEIRTEFELPDKNIKIIFFQKPDFNLFKEN
ncbi:MAG: hypothetical protein ABSF88_01765 [Candidatus Aminicenantales bacterium]|jgi:hypothetical protein